MGPATVTEVAPDAGSASVEVGGAAGCGGGRGVEGEEAVCAASGDGCDC